MDDNSDVSISSGGSIHSILQKQKRVGSVMEGVWFKITDIPFPGSIYTGG